MVAFKSSDKMSAQLVSFFNYNSTENQRTQEITEFVADVIQELKTLSEQSDVLEARALSKSDGIMLVLTKLQRFSYYVKKYADFFNVDFYYPKNFDWYYQKIIIDCQKTNFNSLPPQASCFLSRLSVDVTDLRRQAKIRLKPKNVSTNEKENILFEYINCFQQFINGIDFKIEALPLERPHYSMMTMRNS